jgi:hypothetical protein
MINEEHRREARKVNAFVQRNGAKEQNTKEEETTIMSTTRGLSRCGQAVGQLVQVQWRRSC